MKMKPMFGVLVKNHDEATNTDDLLATRDFRNRSGKECYSKPVPVCLPLMSVRVGTGAGRDYLRVLRAAEMEAWELSGGDYLRSCSASVHDNQNGAFLQSPPNALGYSVENQTAEKTI